MSNLRQLAIKDLKSQNLKDWSLPVIFVDPEGISYSTDNETGLPLKAVQILYDYLKLDPSGMEILVNEPVIVMMRNSLSRIPLSDERWQVKFPLNPETPDVLADNYFLNADRAPEGGQSLGFIRFYPLKGKQSS